MENNNSVAFIAKVSEISPIEGADKIVLAKVEGWTSVAQKDSLNVGDLVICFTTDAVIPQEYAEANNISTYLRKGFRVRTVKLRGVYSECILLKAPEGVKVGQDMQDKLGVFKYEPPAVEVTTASGKKIKKSVNPHFYVYHKFPNVKNVPNMFDENDYVVVTRKVHGSNFRAGITKKHKMSIIDRIKYFFGNKKVAYEFCYGSRTVQKFDGKEEAGFYGKDYWKEVSDKYDLKEQLWNLVDGFGIEDVGEGIVIYGEVYGEGVQGDKYTYGIKGRDLQLFDMQINGKYLGEEKRAYFKYLGVPAVEVLDSGYYSKEMVDSFVKNQFINGTKIPHEGVVVTHSNGDRKKIAKVINPEFLIYSEKNNVPEFH